MRLKTFVGTVLLVLVSVAPVLAQDLAQHLQDISVTVKSPNKYGGEGQGSGVLITRELKVKEGSKETVKVNFVWTAAHVVDNLREVRSVIDPKTGTRRQVVEFRDAQIVQELRENGRRVGEVKMDAKVVRYSDADDGHDLALLLVRKNNFVDVDTEFYLGEEIPAIGTQLYHVGSLLGQVGSNSMTSGIYSQQGRVLQLGTGDGTVFDQTTATAFPGSSGGGVFFSGHHANEKDAKNKGKYVGMLVRGAGEGFNLIVPVRRMREWAEDVDIVWALDPKADTPTYDLIKKSTKIEDIGVSFADEAKARAQAASEEKMFRFWFHNPVPELYKEK